MVNKIPANQNEPISPTPPEHPQKNESRESLSITSSNETLLSPLDASEEATNRLAKEHLLHEIASSSQSRDLRKIVVERRLITSSSRCGSWSPLTLPSHGSTQNPVAKLRPLIFFQSEDMHKPLNFLTGKIKSDFADNASLNINRIRNEIQKMYFLPEQVNVAMNYFVQNFPNGEDQSPFDINEEHWQECISKLEDHIKSSLSDPLDLDAEFENTDQIQSILSMKRNVQKELEENENQQITVIRIRDEDDEDISSQDASVEELIQSDLFDKLGNNFLLAFMWKQLKEVIPKGALAKKEEELLLAYRDSEPFYRKDDLFNLCSMLLSVPHFPQGERERFSSFESIQDPTKLQKKVMQMKGEYISQKKLEEELSREAVDSLKQLKGFKSSVPKYTCLDEVLTHLDNTQLSQDLIRHLSSVDEVMGSIPTVQSSFAIKVGSENPREIIAKTVAQLLGLERFLVGKIPSPFPDVSIGSMPAENAIAGRWVDGHSFGETEWRDFISAKQDYEKAQFNYDNADEDGKFLSEDILRFAKDEYMDCKQDLITCGGKESIQTHALLDLLMGSYDSHLNQYTVMNGEMWGFDLSRIFLPGELQQIGDDELTFTFRSAFFDHPFSEETLDTRLIGKIKNWDENEIEKFLKEKTQILGSKEEFDKMEAAISELVDDFNPENITPTVVKWATNPDTILRSICTKYNVPYDESVSDNRDKLSDLVHKVRKVIISEQNELYAKGKNKIHPKAFEQLKVRMANTKVYIEECEKAGIPPTINGIFKAQYPKMAIFMTVASRFVQNPGQFLALGFSGTRLQERELGQFIKDAIQHEVATEKEIREMENNLDLLRQSSFPKHFAKFMIA